MLRAAYREFLEEFNSDLLDMCDRVTGIMSHASKALLEQSLDDAEVALTSTDSLTEIRQRCEDRAMRLLALQNPVASELRQVISSIYIVENLNRMGALAKNVALLARQRHPASVYPEALHGYVAELARLVDEMGSIVRALLMDPDPDVAVDLHTVDEGVDDMKAYLSTLVTDREWEYTTRQAVDLAMLTRYYERYADRCVAAAGRVVFLVTGQTPEDYLRQRDKANYEPDLKFAEIERRFRAQQQ